MPEYIHREYLEAAFDASATACLEKEEFPFEKKSVLAGMYIAAGIVHTVPAADVAPVVHGRWIPVDGGQHKCSRCHTVRKTDVARDHYCPNCGAKMDGEGETDGT